MISDHDEGIRQMKFAYDQGINVSLTRLMLRSPTDGYWGGFRHSTLRIRIPAASRK